MQALITLCMVSGETLAASIASAYENKDRGFGFYWGPTSVLGKYPMTLVEMGEHKPDVWACNSTAECETPAMSGFPRSLVVTVLAKRVYGREPSDQFTHDKLVLYKLANEQKHMAWVEDNDASYDEGAVHFLTTYKDMWGAWLNDAARDKLSALLK